MRAYPSAGTLYLANAREKRFPYEVRGRAALAAASVASSVTRPPEAGSLMPATATLTLRLPALSLLPRTQPFSPSVSPRLLRLLLHLHTHFSLWILSVYSPFALSHTTLPVWLD